MLKGETEVTNNTINDTRTRGVRKSEWTDHPRISFDVKDDISYNGVRMLSERKIVAVLALFLF